MSQLQLTDQERIAALQRFGYTEREAAFLCLAALHGGYFLRRHYGQFLCRQDGGTVGQLIEKALALNHARALTYHPRTNIYHLYARPFYEVLGQTDNRNRRQREPLTIKNKLMGLDFILAHPDNRYLATEQEKAQYFTGALQLPHSVLPTKLYHSADSRAARYFVEKYPIFLPPEPSAGQPPVVSFCFVDEGMTTLSRFATFLAQYQGLFASLAQFRLIYVAAAPALFESARRAFERFVNQSPDPSKAIVRDSEIPRLLEHFAARRLYETKDLAGFDRTKLVRFRNEREQFSGTKYDALYERWKSVGDRAVLEVSALENPPLANLCGAFSTCLLEISYDLFGTLTAF
jgi:hypothetical protein